MLGMRTDGRWAGLVCGLSGRVPKNVWMHFIMQMLMLEERYVKCRSE